MISSSELKNFQNEPMSPPITPKLIMNDTSSTTSSTITTTSTKDHHHYEDDEVMTLLPPSSKSLEDEEDHHHNKRKESIGLSIHSIKLVNQDENDFYGKRFNFSRMIQPIIHHHHHHDDHQPHLSSPSSSTSLNKTTTCKTRRRKSLPYKSPKGSPYNRMIFKMDVYHRPLQENYNHHPYENVLLSTSLPTSSSINNHYYHHHHYTSSSSIQQQQQQTTMIPNNNSNSSFYLDNHHHHHHHHHHHLNNNNNNNNNKVKLSLTIPSPNLSTTSSSSTTSSLSSPTSPMKPSHTIEKPKADTHFYDHINLSIEDKYIYEPLWIPLWKDFDHRPNIRVVWKGSPLVIHQLPYYKELHSNECSIASTLRLSPEQYLKCKRALILTAHVFYQHGLPFRKSDAQKVCRIDVNKTSCLWNAFNRLGWFQPHMN